MSEAEQNILKEINIKDYKAIEKLSWYASNSLHSNELKKSYLSNNIKIGGNSVIWFDDVINLIKQAKLEGYQLAQKETEKEMLNIFENWVSQLRCDFSCECDACETVNYLLKRIEKERELSKLEGKTK